MSSDLKTVIMPYISLCDSWYFTGALLFYFYLIKVIAEVNWYPYKNIQ